MKKKIDLDFYVDEKDRICDEKSNNKYKLILDKISDVLGFEVRTEDNEYSNIDKVLQIYVGMYNKFPELLELFNDCATEFDFNQNTYIDYAIKKLTESSSNKDIFIQGLLDSGIIDKLNYSEEDGYRLISKSLEISFDSASKYYNDVSEIVEYINDRDSRRTDCHKNALFLLKTLKRGETFTVKQKNIANVDYYHSYYRYNGIITDLNNNLVMSEEDYNKVYKPEVISIIKSSEFEERIKEINENTTNTLMPLLAIAAYDEYRKQVLKGREI